MIVVAKHRLTKGHIHLEDVVWGRWADAECSHCGEVLTAKISNNPNNVKWIFSERYNYVELDF